MINKRDIEGYKEFGLFFLQIAFGSLAMALFFGTLVQIIFP